MNNLKTIWSDTPDLSQYPRPQMVRDSYFSLNGEWDYKIIKGDLSYKPEESEVYDGKIVVPFAPESFLSGVNRTLMPDEVLVYRTFFKKEQGGVALLHFGAVDYKCKVYVNGYSAAEHTGGYTPFECEIQKYMRDGENELTVCVTDPSDTKPISRGKQATNHGGIWYTPTSGIWQSVWMEYLPEEYVKRIKYTSDIDAMTVEITAEINTGAKNFKVITHDGKVFDSVDGKVTLDCKNCGLWSPESPSLYPFEITVGKDKVGSYFALRRFSVGRRKDGKYCFTLNGKPYFMTGLLDQGYWSDGLYTAPSDEALVYDIELAKKCGFNTLRKHIKIEPLRWYFHCDRLGMIVWQDFVNGGGGFNPLASLILPNIGIRIKDSHYGFYRRKDKEGRNLYYKEMKEVVDLLGSCPCIALWTPFNEAWGQFDSLKVCDYLRSLDDTRLIDHASGWSDQGGEIRSIHKYFVPFRMPKREKRPVVLSEFGGYSMKVEDHSFSDKIFGYAIYKETDKLNAAITNLWKKELLPAKKQGLCASIYTQLSDVQSEVNGLVTYDRRVVKVDEKTLEELNGKLIKEFSE